MIQNLGSRLQKLRTERNLSQKQVAQALNVSPALISNYESSERSPSIENLLALARFYHCSTDYLLGLERDNELTMIDASMLNQEQIIFLQQFLSSISNK